jgi:hypothetical protein
MQLYKSQDIGHQMPGVPPIFQILASIFFQQKKNWNSFQHNQKSLLGNGIHEAIPLGEGTRKEDGWR